ncbi:MAG: FecR domain-containing protein [Phenylobacterium sp.]
MTTRETAAEIDDAAAAWAARIDRAPLSPSQDQALDAWLAADSRRQGAFAKARAVLLHLDRARALGADYDPEAFVAEAPRPSRRWMLGAGGAIAASLAATVGVGIWAQSGRYATRRGEVRLVTLADGSALTLNTATRVAVRYSEARRDIHLIEGEALFDVAKNAQRPFVVDTGDVRVRAVGTSFTVRKLPGRTTEVLVREGVVEITRVGAAPVAASAAPVRLAANQRATASRAEPITPAVLAPADVSRELAWREGMIAFEGTSLGAAAAEFARYSDPKIVIDDPVLAERTITGLFSASNPEGFARAAALTFNAQAVRTEDEIRLSR